MPTTIETINIPNFSDNNIVEDLELSADAAPGQPTIAVINPSGVSDGDFLVPSPGSEISEMRQVNTGGVSGSNITFTTNLSIQRRNHERVVKLYGNQIRVYRAPNVDGTIPSDAIFATNLLGSVVIKPDNTFSQFVDTAGGKDFWYKATYYNSANSNETDLGRSSASRGGGWGHYVSIEDVRKEAGIEDTKKLDDTEVSVRRDEAESEIKGKLASAGYIMPLQTQNGAYFTPPVIENISRLLSAGMVLMQNFGTTKPSSAKDGLSKATEARKMLAEIQLNDTILLDTNDQPLAKPTLVDGWPDDSTADNGFTQGPIMTMEKVL